MASIYDKASLVLIPSGTKTSKIYSQKPVSGDGDFTFSRSTAATRVNEGGAIEKETQNLLLQSNTFNTTWVNSNSTETGGQSGYDGTSDAWQLTASSAGLAYLQQSNTQSGVQTFSVYAKAGTADHLQVYITGTDSSHYFDLANGTAFTPTGAGAVDSSIEDIGSGWYRCSCVCNGTNVTLRLYIRQGLNVNPSAGEYIYIQDAQLEQGLVARDYIETTTSAVEGGITDNVPRLDYSGGASCPSLLLEPSRTNLIIQSEYFDASIWTQTNITTYANSTISPEGNQNAYKIVINNGSGGGYIYTNNPSISSGTTYTASFFIKDSGVGYTRFWSKITGTYVNAIINLNTGDIISSTFATTPNVEDYGNGWWRVSYTQTGGFGGTIPIYIDGGVNSNGSTFTGNGVDGIFVFAAQVEAGSYPTSYIPTYGTSVTRNNESTNVQSLNTNSVTTANSAYTIFFDLSSEPVLNVADGNSEFMTIYSGQNLSTATITPRKYYNDADGRIRFYSNIDAYSMRYITSTNKKWVISVNNNVVKFYTDGALQYTYTGTGNHNGIGSLRLTSGGSNRTQTEYSSFLLFNSVLTDAECIDLTT